MNAKGSERINLKFAVFFFSFTRPLKIRAYVEPTLNIKLLAKQKIKSKGYFLQVSSELVDKKHDHRSVNSQLVCFLLACFAAGCVTKSAPIRLSATQAISFQPLPFKIHIVNNIPLTLNHQHYIRPHELSSTSTAIFWLSSHLSLANRL